MKIQKITRVTATPLNVPLHVTLAGADRHTSLACVHVEVETAQGITGHGFTAITEEDVIAQIVNGVAGPAIVGDDAMAHEAIWEKLYWKTMPRGQTGYAAHAVAAIDLALWDIKGKALGQPVWRLIGGARNRVPVYVTFGFGFFDREQLDVAARHWRAQGFTRLKMTVGNEALRRRDQRPLHEVIKEDAARVAAVRDAIGPEAELFVDANCNLDLYHATQLAQTIKPLGIGFFEEPLTQNDVHQMAELRRTAGIPLACGQNEGLLFRFRDLLINKSADILQPNVCISAGITQCLKVAGLAAAFNAMIENGGAWPFHNMHLHAGLANGGMVEYHYLAVELCRKLYRDLPVPEAGWLTLPEAPGLGFEPDRDALREIAKLPLSGGNAKG
jgi:L-alanine-DL-glutamate epimerase-like enolase superfamily enzyme